MTRTHPMRGEAEEVSRTHPRTSCPLCGFKGTGSCAHAPYRQGCVNRAWVGVVIVVCLSVASAYAGDSNQPMVSNVWVETDVRQVIQDMSMQTGITIICDNTVQGIVTMAVKDMPLEDCLERVCAIGEYTHLKVDDYYVVGRPSPGNSLFSRITPPQRVELTHINCDQAKAAIHPTLAQYITYEKSSQTLIVTAGPVARQRIMEAIKLIDRPHRQIVIEAVVFELTEDGAKQLGLDWQYKNASLSVDMSNLVGTVTYDASSDIAKFVEVTLRAIVQQRKGRVLASPRVAVMNGEEADIFVGLEKYFSLLSGQASNPYYRLESIKAGVTLKVKAQIGANGQMVLQLEPEVSDVATETNRDNINHGDSRVNAALPVVTRRRAKTTVSVRDGQTIVLGGLLREQHRSVVEKIPFLGDIPLVGAAFRTVDQRKEQQEVIIVMTAHLVGNDESCPTELPTRLEQQYVSPLDPIAFTTREAP